MARAIRWLHLSDLHLGCRGMEHWWQMRGAFEESIRGFVAERGAPDLLLLSGDLTFKGAEPEIALVDSFLDDLLRWIREAGSAKGPPPLLLAVPGNHDLARPTGRAALGYRVLDKLLAGERDADVRLVEEELWERQDPSFLLELFPHYAPWWQRQADRLATDGRVTLHRSHVPGDFCAEIEIPGVCPLTVVGLNSTWQQYREGEDFEGRLRIPLRQFHAALPPTADGDPLAVFRRRSRALLMLHQPPDWLAKGARKEFFDSIHEPDRFDLCLFGHLHEARSEVVAVSGGKPRFLYQSPSLFGLEHYGTAREERAIGYTWGSLAEDGHPRLWPFLHWIQGGKATFVRDPGFSTDPEGVDLKAAFAVVPRAVTAPPPADFRAYLNDLVKRTDHIKITGVSRAGENRAALRHPIERLYTPLSTRGEGRGLGSGPEKVTLADLLPRHRRLLLEGQPGAGKTTFQRLLACLLARDLLEVPCPEGASWREHYLGLQSGPPLLPVLIRAADLLLVLPEVGLRRDDERLFVDLLARVAQENGLAVAPESWERLLSGKLPGQKAILLVDGLDEVAEEETRARLLEAFRAAGTAWPELPLVVTSRPIETAGLRELGFHVATVEPFGEEEVSLFLARWVGALYGAEEDEPLRAEGEEYRRALTEAICRRSGIRRLATNPVMLTCLCVIHWNEQRLPEGRARVYRAVLRWLLAARTRQREERGFTDYFAERAFARLALALLDSPQGKVALLDLERAAEAVEGVVARDFPDLAGADRAEDRRHKARAWLAFECLGSGIVEEVSGRRLRFWHLTFQEFLAALQLAWWGDGETPGADWWPAVEKRLDDVQWRETVELLPGCLLDEGGEGRVDRLLERVLALRGKRPSLPRDAKVAGIVGRLLQPLGACGYRPQPALLALYQETLEKSLALFTREGAVRVPVKHRIAAAEALGRGGDPRLAPEKDNFLEVPGMGEWRLGKYPVTVEEYQRFVESRGYEERAFWDDEGWAAREAGGWERPDGWEAQLETPNRPVVGVSWHEARACCRWLSELQRREVRLPTAAEWVKAATPARGDYPWGEEEPDAERANFDGNVNAPTPVGLYPLGDGPYGHCDLAGNVWEWCEDQEGLEGWRALRGGAFWGSAEDLRSAYRIRSPASYRSHGCGFRAAAAAPRAF